MGLIALAQLLLTINCSRRSSLILARSQSTDLPSTVIVDDTLPTPCDIAGPVVGQAKEWEGVVTYYGHPQYHGNTGLYCIIHSEPIDSAWLGYVCNQMPDKFKQNGLRVIFSGKYYHAYKDIKHTGRDSQRLLYLRLQTALLHGYVGTRFTALGIPNFVNRFRQLALTRASAC